jgi:hypothetical protein
MRTCSAKHENAARSAIRPRSDSSPAAVSAEKLRDEHAHLERVYEALLNAYRSDDWTVVREHWNVFEKTLRQHMAFEEDHLFPSFREAHATDTAALLAEHAQLKSELETLGVNIELHSVSERDVKALLVRLRAHAARESNTFYPWFAASLRT